LNLLLLKVSKLDVSTFFKEGYGDYQIFSHGSQVRYRVELEKFMNSSTFHEVAVSRSPFEAIWGIKLKFPFSVGNEERKMTINGPGKVKFRKEFVDAIRLLIHELPEPANASNKIPEDQMFDTLRHGETSKTSQASILMIFHKCHCPFETPEDR
jgi:hypothetical protein